MNEAETLKAHLQIAESMYVVAIKERDYERHRVGTAELELVRLRAILEKVKEVASDNANLHGDYDNDFRDGRNAAGEDILKVITEAKI